MTASPPAHDDKLVGMITEESIMDLATKVLEGQMGVTELQPLPLDEKK